jgi:hypothetical protein
MNSELSRSGSLVWLYLYSHFWQRVLLPRVVGLGLSVYTSPSFSAK